MTHWWSSCFCRWFTPRLLFYLFFTTGLGRLGKCISAGLASFTRSAKRKSFKMQHHVYSQTKLKRNKINCEPVNEVQSTLKPRSGFIWPLAICKSLFWKQNCFLFATAKNIFIATTISLLTAIFQLLFARWWVTRVDYTLYDDPNAKAVRIPTELQINTRINTELNMGWYMCYFKHNIWTQNSKQVCHSPFFFVPPILSIFTLKLIKPLPLYAIFFYQPATSLSDQWTCRGQTHLLQDEVYTWHKEPRLHHYPSLWERFPLGRSNSDSPSYSSFQGLHSTHLFKKHLGPLYTNTFGKFFSTSSQSNLYINSSGKLLFFHF